VNLHCVPDLKLAGLFFELRRFKRAYLVHVEPLLQP
jgi:hypothetical protein